MGRDSSLIRVKLSTKEMLRRLGEMGDSYDAVIRRLLDQAEASGGAASLPVEVCDFLREVAEASGGGIVDVGDAVSRLIAKLGALLGYKGEDFTDWGVRETARARIVTFLGIDDRLTLKTAIVSRVLDSLIKEDGVHELIPLRDEVLFALAQAKMRRVRRHEA